MRPEERIVQSLRDAAARAYGQGRADELQPKLDEVGRWIARIEQQPLDLLNEEPDTNGD